MRSAHTVASAHSAFFQTFVSTVFRAHVAFINLCFSAETSGVLKPTDSTTARLQVRPCRNPRERDAGVPGGRAKSHANATPSRPPQPLAQRDAPRARWRSSPRFFFFFWPIARERARRCAHDGRCASCVATYRRPVAWRMTRIRGVDLVKSYRLE